jgi:hypothetical protein
LLAKADAWSTTVLVDELNAGGFEGAANRDVARCRRGCLDARKLGATNDGEQSADW